MKRINERGSVIIMLAASSALLAPNAALPNGSQNPSSVPDVRQIVLSSVTATQRHWREWVLYSYLERDETRHLDLAGHVKSEEVDVSRAFLVDGVQFEQLVKWASRYPKLCVRVEGNIEETLSFYRLPRQHHKNLKSTNMLERIMEEIKRRTLVVRIFPNAAGCLRLVRALAVEMHENWIEAIRYLNMEPLREQNKDVRRQIEDAA
jgi:hypothetical protein